MTIPKEKAAQIRRLHFAEHWPVGTIAAQLGVHEEVVQRVVGLLQPRVSAGQRDRILDPYAKFIEETLKRYPKLRATRLHDMLVERGFDGSVRTVRAYVERMRPRPKHEAYVRLQPLMGEQAQVDWAHAGKLEIDGAVRDLWVFVMVLSWSRGMWAEFVLDMTVHSVLRSIVRALTDFGGTARQLLFDNPKTIVAERCGDAVRFHPLMLELSGHYCFEIRLCTPRKANQKGRVERLNRFLRDRFFAARRIITVEQGNREISQFIEKIAHPRRHPTLKGRSVGECLEEERGRLLSLPEHPMCTDLVLPVSVDKTAFVRFDKNDYSVPHEHAQSTLTLAADDRQIRLVSAGKEVARHDRCWGTRKLLELPEHREALLKEKAAAKTSSARSRLTRASPQIHVLFERWIDEGRNAGNMTLRTVKLLELYGDDVFRDAVDETVERGLHDIGALAIACENRRRATNAPMPIEVQLSDHVPDRDVIPHNLEDYDEK